ncbi:hypothetical protein AB0C96_31940 [Streptomyces sp. NPDC048506]|uniref:hypothetical protein n=1 Tax=Streptomyces sp. NPDC048506 TaxID=3155028 RepID=UPI00342CEA9E
MTDVERADGSGVDDEVPVACHQEAQIRNVAVEAGAADPESLGRHIAVIFEGANALAASCNDVELFTDARRAAKTLLDVALSAAPGR